MNIKVRNGYTVFVRDMAYTISDGYINIADDFLSYLNGQEHKYDVFSNSRIKEIKMKENVKKELGEIINRQPIDHETELDRKRRIRKFKKRKSK